MKLLYSLILSLLFLSILVDSKSLLKNIKNKEKPLLRFKDNGKFKLVIFADLHYGEFPGTIGPINDAKSSEVMTNILSWEKPDLVIFTGDQLTGDNIASPNASGYLDIVVKPCLDGNYKWASTYGNHDNGANLLRMDMFLTESKYDLSYTQYGGEDLPGISNYYLLLYPPTNAENADKPSMVLWFFDSQGNNYFSGEEIVDPKVVSFFKTENQRLLDLYQDLPGLAFFHIPTEEYAEVKETVDDNPLCNNGLNGERVYAQDYNSGLMDALSDAGNIRTTFVGHDHANSWCCFYKNLEVCYNRHTGYGGYGWWERGARVVDLNFYNLETQKNYLRMESKEIISQFPNPEATML